MAINKAQQTYSAAQQESREVVNLDELKGVSISASVLERMSSGGDYIAREWRTNPTFLDASEQQQLVEILAGVPELRDPAQRATFLKNAGVAFLENLLNLSGFPRVFAVRIVSLAESYGQLPSNPHVHTLGALLAYTLKLDVIPSQEQLYLARLIIRHRLVEDKDYLSYLQKQYGLYDLLPADTAVNETFSTATAVTNIAPVGQSQPSRLAAPTISQLVPDSNPNLSGRITVKAGARIVLQANTNGAERYRWTQQGAGAIQASEVPTIIFDAPSEAGVAVLDVTAFNNQVASSSSSLVIDIEG